MEILQVEVWRRPEGSIEVKYAGGSFIAWCNNCIPWYAGKCLAKKVEGRIDVCCTRYGGETREFDSVLNQSDLTDFLMGYFLEDEKFSP
jgi:hypothetical protein